MFFIKNQVKEPYTSSPMVGDSTSTGAGATGSTTTQSRVIYWVIGVLLALFLVLILFFIP